MTRGLVRFVAVGGAGFLTDATLLWALVGLGGDPFLMRLISFAVAVRITWWGNRCWTFAGQDSGGFGAYLAVQLTGMALNYAVYASLVALLPPGAGWAVLALAAGSAVGLVANYLGAARLVFRGPVA